jgi:hypothetical protein
VVSDVDWDTKDGHYRVRLEGEWIDVPEDALITEPNRAGADDGVADEIPRRRDSYSLLHAGEHDLIRLSHSSAARPAHKRWFSDVPKYPPPEPSRAVCIRLRSLSA